MITYEKTISRRRRTVKGNPKTPQEAITAKCRECVDKDYSAMRKYVNWYEQVSNCRLKECPLWAFRPVEYPASLLVKERYMMDMTDEEKIEYAKKLTKQQREFLLRNFLIYSRFKSKKERERTK